MTDHELLAAYSSKGSQEAFAEIVNRHTDLVYSTCLRMLGDAHTAEDATQATFIALMQKADKLSRKIVLAGWLYRAAEYAARHVLRERARRARHERRAAEVPRTTTQRTGSWEEAKPHLDAALAALPRAQRDVVVLRCMKGMSSARVAREMGCAKRTVQWRLGTALARMGKNLRRRGVSVTTAFLMTLLAERTVHAAPPALAASVHAACFGKTAVSATAVAIKEGIMSALMWMKVKAVAGLLLAVALVSAGTSVAVMAGNQAPPVPSSGLDEDLLPHAGRWTSANGVWQTVGQEPPGGWYLRSRRRYDLDSLSFRVQKERVGGLVYLYTTHWRVLLRRDSITVKYAPQWTKYWFTVQRQIPFPARTWHDFTLGLDGDFLTVRWDGREVIRWNSPAAEWKGKVAASAVGTTAVSARPGVKFTGDKPHAYPERLPEEGLRGEDEIVVFHALHTSARLGRIRLSGRDAGEAEGFHEDRPPEPEYTRPDTELDRLAPLEPVEVSWSLAPDELSRARNLPAIGSWSVAAGDRAEIGEFISKQAGKRGPEYLVGAVDHGKFPEKIFGPRGWPQDVSVHFNLREHGHYTLKTEWGIWGLGWGPNVLEIAVDGKPVSREVYRALSNNYFGCEVKDYVPLLLRGGPHRIDLKFSRALIKKIHYMMKYMWIPLGEVSLLQGIEEPLLERKAYTRPGLQHRDEALTDHPWVGEQYGKVIRYRITGLTSERRHRIAVGFYEVDVRRPGQRLMDIFINGRQVELNLDVLKEAGWRSYVEKTYAAAPAVMADGGRSLEIRLVGENFKAFLNHLKIDDPEGRTAFEENCGWSPNVSDRFNKRMAYQVEGKAKPLPAEPPAWTPEEVFDGHNLVANPHFSLKDDRGKPAWWYSGRDLRDKFKPAALNHYDIIGGPGEYALDEGEGHDEPGSLRIEKTGRDFGVTCTWPAIDYGKLQKLSYWVKTDGATGKIFPEIVWYAQDMDCGLKGTPRLRMLSRHAAEGAVTGTTGWRQVELSARPPFGACFACPIIRVDGNTRGRVWIDDAEFNGYGAESIEITCSRLGYHPWSDKQLVVKTFTKAPVLWELAAEPSGRVVRSGKAAYHSHEWFSKRHYYRIDLTSFRESGSYRLRAVQGENATATDPFTISRDAYRRLAGILLDGLYIKRFNLDIPGAHEPDAMDDARMIRSAALPRLERYGVFEHIYLDARMDGLGGYYDAGDEMKHIEFWPPVLLATYHLQRDFQPPLKKRTPDDGLDEMLWAFGSFHKYVTEEGSVYTSVKPQSGRTDNIPGCGVDRHAAVAYPLPQAAGVAALGSYVLRDMPGHGELSRVNLAAAVRNYEYNRLWERAQSDPDPGCRLHFASKALFAEMYLFKLTGEREYERRMDRHARIVARGLKGKAYQGSWELSRSHHPDASALQDFVWVPCLFLELCPDRQPRADIEEALRAFADDVRRVSNISPWGQARDLTTPGDKVPARYPDTERPAGYWPMLAYSLSRTGMLLKDKEIVRLAERQLQWCLGKNFADMSMVHGVGHRFVAGGDMLFHQGEFFDAWLNSGRRLMYYDGCVPTLAFRDLGSGEVRTRNGDDWWPPLEGYPQGYCRMYLQPDYPVHPAPTEYFLPQTAQFALAAAGVHAALESLRE